MLEFEYSTIMYVPLYIGRSFSVIAIAHVLPVRISCYVAIVELHTGRF